MQEILDAILSGRTPEHSPGWPSPRPTGPSTVHKDEATCSRASRAATRTRASRCTSTTCPMPELGPGEALVAVMASAINYNTVWTSIFEPVSTFGFLERYGRTSRARQAARPALPRRRLRPGRRRAAHRPRRHQVEARRRGRRALPVGRARGPDGHNDTMLDPQQRIWGFETNFGGLAELALVKSNQLMPKPAHLTWEEAASPGLVNSTAYRQLVSSNGAGMKQGDTVLIWGASGGLGSYATQWRSTAAPRRSASSPRPEKAEICRAMGAELVIDRNAEGYRFWKDEQHPGPEGVEALRQEDPRADRRRGRRHRLRAPGPRDLRRQRLRGPQGRHDRHLRLDRGLHARVRQPLPLDEPQADHRLALRQLPRGVGGQPADRQGDDPPDAVEDLLASTRSARRRTTSTRTCTRARSACSAWRPRRARRARTPRSAPSTETRSTGSATPDLRRSRCGWSSCHRVEACPC